MSTNIGNIKSFNFWGRRSQMWDPKTQSYVFRQSQYGTGVENKDDRDRARTRGVNPVKGRRK